MAEGKTSHWQIPRYPAVRYGIPLFVLCAALWLPQAAQAIEKFNCTERWFDTTKEGARVSQRQPDRIQACAAKKSDNPARDTGYRFANGLFYEYATDRERSSPCMGAGWGNVGQMFDPVCWMPSKLQLHRTEVVRTFWLATTRLQPSAPSHRCKRCAPLMTPNIVETDISELAGSHQIGE